MLTVLSPLVLWPHLAVGSGAAGCGAPDEDATDEALLLEEAVDALRWTPAAATLAELV